MAVALDEKAKSLLVAGSGAGHGRRVLHSQG
jgi:hypothetical protein